MTARVIVTAYNQLPQLGLALQGYLRQSVTTFRLVVADDGSAPDTGAFVESFAETAKRRGIEVEHVWQADEGFRKTRILNEAVRRARGEALYLFTDGDCIPPARFVERHLEVHEPYSFHVGGGVRLSEELSRRATEEDVTSGRFETWVTRGDLRDLGKRARKSRWGTWLGLRHRPKILGLNMAFDADLFESLNGFDERFGAGGFEDSDVRDRAMRHRPRPKVKVLYGRNDVFHLWHPVRPAANAEYRRRQKELRPVRCVQGLNP